MASLRRYDSGQLDAFDEIVVLESRAEFGCEGCISIASVADRGNTALPGCRTSLRRPDCRRKRLIVIDKPTGKKVLIYGGSSSVGGLAADYASDAGSKSSPPPLRGTRNSSRSTIPLISVTTLPRR